MYIDMSLNFVNMTVCLCQLSFLSTYFCLLEFSELIMKQRGEIAVT